MDFRFSSRYTINNNPGGVFDFNAHWHGEIIFIRERSAHKTRANRKNINTILYKMNSQALQHIADGGFGCAIGFCPGYSSERDGTTHSSQLRG